METRTANRLPADDGRLAELILHVSARCADWEPFDAAMLERMLFQSDFLHYREQGRSITGQAYRRGLVGPSPRGLSRVLRAIAREFAMLESPLGDGLHVSRRPVALRAARLSGFDGQEIATVERVIWHYRRAWNPALRGPDLLGIPWEGALHREVLPYALALLAPAADGAAPARALPAPAPEPGPYAALPASAA
jgi:hypothetical protein